MVALQEVKSITQKLGHRVLVRVVTTPGVTWLKRAPQYDLVQFPIMIDVKYEAFSSYKAQPYSLVLIDPKSKVAHHSIMRDVGRNEDLIVETIASIVGEP